MVSISKEKVRAMFNSRVKINILLYNVALTLELVVWMNVLIHMKRAGNHTSHFIDYVSDMSVKIKKVVVKTLFFILEQESNLCILSHSFETVT